MATSTGAVRSSAQKLSVTRLVAAGGVTAAAVFVVCWLGTFIPFSSPTHAYISLFTPADVNSANALVQGTFWSLLFGALSGALFAIVYNAFAGLERR